MARKLTVTGPRPVPELATAGKRRRAAAITDVVLESGLRVIAVRKPGTPLVEVRLRIPFGRKSATSNGNGPGVHSAKAELLSAGLLLGTANRDREQVDAELAMVGGHLDAGVDAQRLMLSGSVLSTGLNVLLDVLADTLTGAVYRAKDINGERDRLVEHLMISGAQPSVIAHRHLQLHRFGNHPAAWDMPAAEDVAQVTAAAVRGLHRRAVVPAGSTLVLVGDLSPKAAVAAVGQALGEWTTPGTAVPLSTPPHVQGSPLAAFDRPGAVQSQVRLSAAAVDRSHEGYAAQQLANLIYGGYFSSRLVENIREDKGYTYSARSGVEFWPGTAALSVSFDTNTESTAPALWEARYELGRLALVPPSEKEIESARNYALGTLATSLSTQAGLASTLSGIAGADLELGWIADHPGRLAAVTGEQVHAMSRVIFAPTAFTGVVVGDLSAVGAQLSAVGDVDLP